MDHVIELRKRVSDLERQVSNLADANVELWKQNKELRAELLQQTEEQNDWAELQNRRYSEYTE
jgi:regulator of replication initiation timing